ncbi:imm11 family protein [Archangium lansingense]|uniref:imm11 family protein n=1 Tax=Archangium lansingense TaxID=2995310 RepID=UPI003B7F3409
MPRRYFELSDDLHIPGRWELGVPMDEHEEKVWTWLFRRGELADIKGQLRVPLYGPGKPLDFSLAGAAVPIVHAKVAFILKKLAPADVQLIPVEVESQTESYFILNTLRVVKCINDAACEEVKYWRPEDGQPELVGEYRVVSGMRIEPSLSEGAHLFRPWGWPVALVVSEDIKNALERVGTTGTRFEDVTGPGA